MNTFSRRLYAVVSALALMALWLAHSTAQAQTVNWVTWTAPSSYPYASTTPSYTYANGASGTLTLPDDTVVNLVLTGEVLQYSCFASTIGNCPSGWWKSSAQGWGPNNQYPSGTFTSPNVPSVPNSANLITQAGYVSAVARHTLTFSKPVTNIVMPIVSLGGTSGLSAYRFDQDFTLLSQDTKCATAPIGTAPPINCLAVQGRTLTGREGSGTVQFTGSFTSISWEVTVPEVFSGFNIGVTSASFTDQAPLTLTASQPHILVASGTALLSTSGGSGTGDVSYTVASGPCTVSGNTLTGSSEGTCRVTATKAGDASHASITSNTVTLTVIKPLYVTYDGNGQTYGTEPIDSLAYDAQENVTVLNPGFLQRANHTFGGWNTAANGGGTPHAAGGSFAIHANTTLYAQWVPTTYSVTYSSNGATSGSAPAAQTKTPGTDLTLATNSGALARTDYSFQGWNTATDGSGTDFAAGSAYGADAPLTLHAKWQHLPTTLSSLSPTSGTSSGGTVVTLNGTYLTGTTSVTFGGVAATNVQVISDTQVQATVPASTNGAAGAVHVVITAPYGSATLGNAYTYIGKPGAPTSVTATPSGDGSVRVSWAAPSDGGAAIAGYRAVAYLPDGVTEAGACTAAANATSCVITGLANATPYVFRVSASNAEGTGSGGAAPSWYVPALDPQVPTMGGTAKVTIAGCTASSITSSFTNIPPHPPARAVFPAGAFRFNASGCSAGETVTVSITYPQPLPANIQLQKYGPKTPMAPPSDWEWFPAPGGVIISADRKTISYTVTNNGAGDGDNAADAISDPFAPLFIPADPTGIPTLSEWSLALLSLLAATLGFHALRRRRTR